MSQQWQEEARRIGGHALVQLLSEIRDGQLDLMATCEITSKKVVGLESTTAHLLSGFPAADVDGHRRYHESVIEWRDLRNKLVREALVKIAGAGTLAACGWIVVAVWDAFKVWVNR